MRMKRPTVTVTLPSRKKPGRKPISTTDEPAVGLHVKLDPPVFDRLYKFARTRARASEAEVMRRALDEYLERHDRAFHVERKK